ncbi:MAG: PKD domain-containing protein [Bacteroidia bacterium]|nr:PKD domain-containing protein [Bacteroidia bacterium]
MKRIIKTKTPIILFVFLIFTSLILKSQPAVNPLLLNTGINSTFNGTKPLLSNDNIWMASITGSVTGYTNAVVCGNQAPASWINSPFGNADWITYPHTCVPGQPAVHTCDGYIGIYYKATFNLPDSICKTHFDSIGPTDFCLNLDFYGDNCVSGIWVNGVLSYTTPITNDSAKYYYQGYNTAGATHFSDCSNWNSGTNEIIVLVYSGYTWEGFLCQANLTTSQIPFNGPLPTSTLSINNPPCGLNTYTLNVVSPNPNYTYVWEPGSITGSSIIATTSVNAVYTVNVTDKFGCESSNTTTIVTSTPPTSVSLNINNVCANQPINPNLGSSITAPYTTTWDFGDGNGSSLNNLSHTYTISPNVNTTFTVHVDVTDANGCQVIGDDQVTVYAIPTASFTSDSACLGSPSHLFDASIGNGNTVNTFQWDFLSNGTIDATGTTNPSFTFPNFGNNVVSYTVSTSPVSGLNCTNSNNTITVWVNPLPNPDFTFINNCVNTQPNSFNASPSTIAIGTNTNYAWNFGDGVSSSNNSATSILHNYPAAGVYNVTLTVTSNKGCIKNIVKPVEVYEKPKVSILNTSPCDQTPTNFSTNTLANSGTVSNWYWDFNNSINSIEGTGQNTNFTFPSAGTQTIQLVCETDKGCRDTLTKIVYVNYIPLPQFTLDIPAGCPIHCVNFTDLTPAVTGPAQINQWTWNLGDGSPITNNTNAPVSHCYNNTSSSQLAYYNVQLTVTTDSGCTNTITKNNYVTVYPVPIAAYVANPNPANVIDPLVYFTNQSQNYTNWWWGFGDGPMKEDSIHVDPTHQYSSDIAQTYYSSLIVQNQYGCLDTAYLPVEIEPDFSFYIPNAFTPSNNDGHNDYFNGKGIGIIEYDLRIFDRWGEEIFHTNDLNKGWDGSVKKRTVNTKYDVYVWKVSLKDIKNKEHQYVGHVTLVK